MPFKESTGYCATCNKQVSVRRETTNDVLYAILTIFSCGLWVLSGSFRLFQRSLGFARFVGAKRRSEIILTVNGSNSRMLIIDSYTNHNVQIILLVAWNRIPFNADSADK